MRERKCLSPPTATRGLHARWALRALGEKERETFVHHCRQRLDPLFVRQRQNTDIDFPCNKLLSM